jgi:hypothetical protein
VWGIINRFGGVGYANGYKSKKIDTPAVTLSVSVPKATDQLGVRQTILSAISGTGMALQSYRYSGCG